MSEIRDRLLRLMLDATDRHDLPLTVQQVQALAADVARGFEPPVDIPALTRREMDVLGGLYLGERAVDTGRRLFMAESTVKTHRWSLYRKFGVRSSAEAVALALQCGLLRPEPLALVVTGVSA
ncbi:helix-turn-helix domain-containing protein [Streptomyces sp. DSM 40750]|uniref:helix-turn-helix domain-containing protein n=1 Tax=Streptomyces sp. DSM 40750 TaxID=2801030 RepID=UPI00214C1211|nr:helix-turn-helix transcriptional regulator [Streptomyces sp. DSM 40750]UUU21674.1 helix-turn-helix transcriptional regulator [Streptomyces sp. DSM 40750]